MQGTGNDFVIIDAQKEKVPINLNEFSRKIADRHFGIGCDQVLIIDKSEKADFKMLIFNNDGSEVEMCGNGIRCLAKYVYGKGLTNKKQLEVETLAGIIKPKIIGNSIKVDMGEPKFKTEDWIFEEEKYINKKLNLNGLDFNVTLVSMGNPHCVIFVDEITDELVTQIGSKIENYKSFPNRINVEFVKILNKNELRMRVWERGAGETLACGTGASASAVAAMLNNLTKRKITIHLLGGDLQIEWADDNHVYLTGPAEFVFEGNF